MLDHAFNQVTTNHKQYISEYDTVCPNLENMVMVKVKKP